MHLVEKCSGVKSSQSHSKQILANENEANIQSPESQPPSSFFSMYN